MHNIGNITPTPFTASFVAAGLMWQQKLWPRHEPSTLVGVYCTTTIRIDVAYFQRVEPAGSLVAWDSPVAGSLHVVWENKTIVANRFTGHTKSNTLQLGHGETQTGPVYVCMGNRLRNEAYRLPSYLNPTLTLTLDSYQLVKTHG